MKTLILLFFTLPLFACNKKTDVPVTPHAADVKTKAPPILQNDSVTYLAVGDSYTYGVGLPQSESYPYQIAAQLRNDHYLASDPTVVAFQGWTAADLLSGMAAAHIHQKFDFVTLLIGVNDINKGTSTDIYTARLDQLITTAVGYANGYSNRVFVISIPDWSVTPFAAGMDTGKIKANITLFNTINQIEALKLGANYIDITALSEQAATDPTLTGADGLHPSAKGYSQWVGLTYARVVATFK